MSVVDEAYVRKISDLEQSNENLQSYVKRLEIQLREYQLEMPDFQSNEDDIDQKERESDRPLPPWISGSDHFSPLLAAYDRRIGSLEDALGQKTEVIKELRSRAEKIVEDDGTIRKSLEQYMQKCVDLVEDRHGSENKSVENVLTELVSNENSDLMSSQLKNANETISVMEEQIDLLEKEMDNIKRKAKLREEQLEAVSTHWHKTKLSLDEKSESCRKLENENEVLNKTLQERTSELVQRKGQVEKLEQNLEETKKELDQERSRNQKLEEKVKEITERCASERESHRQQLVVAERSLKGVKTDLRDARDKHWKLHGEHRLTVRDLDKTRVDCKGMLEVIESYERKIKMLTEREQRVQVLSKTTREEIQSALLTRDRAVAKAEQSREEIKRLQQSLERVHMDARRAQSEAIASARLVSESVIKKRDAEIKDLRKSHVEVIAERERVLRDRNEVVEDRNRISKLLEEERERNKTLSVERERVETEKLKQIERANEKIEDLSEDAEQTKSELTLQRNLTCELRETLRTQKENLEAEIQILNENLCVSKEKLEKLQSECRSQNHTQLQLQDRNRAFSGELETLRTENERLRVSNMSFERRLKDIESAERSSRARANVAEEELRTHVEVRSREKSREMQSRSELERRVEMLRRRVESAETRSNALCQNLDTTRADLEEAGNVIGELESALERAEMRATSARRHVAKLMSTEEMLVSEKRTIRIECERLRRRCDRMRNTSSQNRRDESLVPIDDMTNEMPVFTSKLDRRVVRLDDFRENEEEENHEFEVEEEDREDDELSDELQVIQKKDNISSSSPSESSDGDGF